MILEKSRHQLMADTGNRNGLDGVLESFSDDLACVGDQDKCSRFYFFDIVSEADRLMAVQYGKDETFRFPRKSALRLAGCRTAVELMHDKITDRFRIVADNIEIFAQVKTLNDVVDHQRTDRKTEERIKTGLNVKDKTSCDRDRKVGQQKRPSDIKIRIFFQNCSDDICSATGSADIE